MGSCQTAKIIENKPKTKSKTSDDKLQYFKEEQKEKELYPDMPEWEGDRYTGVGIKTMKGYKCTLPIDELYNLRLKFWNEKYDKDTIWYGIMNACYIDEIQSKAILTDLNLYPVRGCINHLRDKNNTNYFIPNYCINDPYFEKSLVVDDEVKETLIQIVLFEGSKELNIPIIVSNQLKGDELKRIYFDKTKESSDNFKLRLFFSGTEIKDDQYLYKYRLLDHYKVQLMKIPI